MVAKVFKPILVVSVIALIGLLTACTQGGLSAEEAEALQAELAEVQSRLDDIEAAVTDLQETDVDVAQQEEIASEVTAAVDEARTRLQEMDETLTPPEPAATDPAMNQPVAPGTTAPSPAAPPPTSPPATPQ